MNATHITQAHIDDMAAMRRQGYSVREIAAAMQDQGVTVSPTTVSRYMRRAGVVADEGTTYEATAARVKAAKQRVYEQALSLLEDAEAARERVYAPAEVVVSTPDGADVVKLTEPPLADTAKVLQTVERLVTNAQRLLATIQDDTGEEAKSLLVSLQEHLEAWADATEDDATAHNEPGMTYDSEYDVRTDPEQQP